MILQKITRVTPPRITGIALCAMAALLPLSAWPAKIVVTQRATVEKITFADTAAFSDASLGTTTTLSLFGNTGDSLTQNYLVPQGATGFSAVPGSPDFSVSIPFFTPGAPNDQYSFLTTAINPGSTGFITIAHDLAINVAPGGAVTQLSTGSAGGYYYLDEIFNPVGSQSAGSPFSYKVVIPGNFSTVGAATGEHLLVNLNPAWTIDKNFLFNGINTVFQAHIDIYDPTVDQIQLEFRIFGAPVSDVDGDGIADEVDNCINVYNPTQLDADGDGYGNACDADLNNSGLVTAADFSLLRSCLNQPATASPLCAAADLNGSGTVTSADFAILRSYLNKPPGPSGLHP